MDKNAKRDHLSLSDNGDATRAVLLPDSGRENARERKEHGGGTSLADQRADRLIQLATIGAAVVGASPVPFSDSALLVPGQVIMMRHIARIYGVDVSHVSTKSLAVAATARTVGSGIAGNTLKFIPGADIGGMVVNAVVASGLTAATGKAWKIMCEAIISGSLDHSDVENYSLFKALFLRKRSH